MSVKLSCHASAVWKRHALPKATPLHCQHDIHKKTTCRAPQLVEAEDNNQLVSICNHWTALFSSGFFGGLAFADEAVPCTQCLGGLHCLVESVDHTQLRQICHVGGRTTALLTRARSGPKLGCSGPREPRPISDYY